jgi:hypothetical protein
MGTEKSGQNKIQNHGYWKECSRYVHIEKHGYWKELTRRDVLDTTLCNKVCHWLETGRWLSSGSLISSTTKSDLHDIAEICWKCR